MVAKPKPIIMRGSTFETRKPATGIITIMMKPGAVKGVDALLAALERVKRAISS